MPSSASQSRLMGGSRVLGSSEETLEVWSELIGADGEGELIGGGGNGKGEHIGGGGNVGGELIGGGELIVGGELIAAATRASYLIGGSELPYILSSSPQRRLVHLRLLASSPSNQII